MSTRFQIGATWVLTVILCGVLLSTAFWDFYPTILSFAR